MKISQEDIVYMVTESVKRILSEGYSKVLYHFTGLKNCIGILSKNQFYLTMSSNQADSFDKKRLFYLSTQRSRSKDLGYAGHMTNCVRIQLDGDALSNNFKGRPVDYWGVSMGKQSYYNDNANMIYGSGLSRSRQTHHNFEMEDRIFSYEPTIENAKRYIKRIDVYLDVEGFNEKIQRYENWLNDASDEEKKKSLGYQLDIAKRNLVLAKESASVIYRLCGNNIPVYFYDNLRDFNFMTDNTINNEIKDVYENDYESNRPIDYQEKEGYRLSKERQSRTMMLNVIENLFIVLTFGEVFRMDNRERYIAKTLKAFGLEKYITDTIKMFNKRWGNSFDEACSLLTSTVNAPIRKLNMETQNDDANKIMKFGAAVLKKYGASNFEELRRKYND